MNTKRKSDWDNARDVARQRERRRSDPAYREAYNKLRREYYAKKKLDPEYMEKLKANRRKRDATNKRTVANAGK